MHTETSLPSCPRCVLRWTVPAYGFFWLHEARGRLLSFPASSKRNCFYGLSLHGSWVNFCRSAENVFRFELEMPSVIVVSSNGSYTWNTFRFLRSRSGKFDRVVRKFERIILVNTSGSQITDTEKPRLYICRRSAIKQFYSPGKHNEA